MHEYNILFNFTIQAFADVEEMESERSRWKFVLWHYYYLWSQSQYIIIIISVQCLLPTDSRPSLPWPVWWQMIMKKCSPQTWSTFSFCTSVLQCWTRTTSPATVQRPLFSVVRMGAWSSDKIYCVHFSRVGVSYFQPCLQVYLEQSDFFQFWEDFEVLFRLVVFSGLGCSNCTRWCSICWTFTVWCFVYALYWVHLCFLPFLCILHCWMGCQIHFFLYFLQWVEQR